MTITPNSHRNRHLPVHPARRPHSRRGSRHPNRRRRRPGWQGVCFQNAPPNISTLEALPGKDAEERFDCFGLAQLREVVAVCRTSRTLGEARKTLFAVSRQSKQSVNDSDRLRKYLARFGLDFKTVQQTVAQP